MKEGLITALVTPFKEGLLDLESFEKLLQHQADAQVSAIVILGTTGEASTLSFEERRLLIEKAKQSARIPFWVGCTDNDTGRALELVAQAQELGAGGVMIAAPYYNKPSEEGLRQHYRALIEKSRVPVMLYNNPGRSAVSMSSQLLVELAQDPKVQAIKESSGSLKVANELINTLPAHCHFLCGDDAWSLPLISIGAKGLVSVLSNLMPKEMNELVSQALRKEPCHTLYQSLYPFMEGCFIESSPSPVKYMMSEKGLCRAELRLPLVEPCLKNKEELKALCKQEALV